MGSILARLAYSTLLRLLTPAYLVRLWWRGRREPAYRSRWVERLALGGPRTEPGAVWVHAVSLGETRAAAALVKALRATQPGLRLLLTHGTATGREAGHALLSPGDVQVWAPLDTPGATRRFLARHRPRLGVVMETEVWPNLLHAAGRAGVPMVLANARLSDKSHRSGERFGALMRPAVAEFERVLAQTPADGLRLRQMGARDVRISGNLKFDMTPPPRLVARGLEWRQRLGRPVVLAASTREGEEVALLHAWRALPQPRPLLLLVPRHPQRFDAVAGLITQQGWALCRRSAFTDAPPVEAALCEVWLGDSLGEMPTYCGMSDVGLLGGSFEPLGGQNLIELAACGCPVVMGPHTFNFADAAERALEAGAALRVTDIAEGVARAAALATDPGRNALVRHAFDFAAAHRGAAQRMADELVDLLGRSRPAG